MTLSRPPGRPVPTPAVTPAPTSNARAPRPGAGRKRTAKPLQLGVKLAVSALLVGAILVKVPWRSLADGVRRLDPWLWLSVWGVFLLGHAVGAMKWRLSVNVGRARLGRVDAFQCYFAGMFANLCLPSIVGGDALKALLAGRTSGRYEAAVFGGLAERLIDTLALLGLIVAGAALSHQDVPGWAQRTMVVAVVVACGALLLFLPLVLKLRLERLPPKLRRVAGRAMIAMRRLRRRPHVALTILLLSLAIQSLFVLLNALLGRGIGIELPLSFWFLVIPLAKAVTLVPISLGGFGLREATVAALLALGGVPHGEGVAVSLLWQTIVVATGLLGGLVWLLLGLRPSAKTGLGHGSLFDARHA